MRLWRSRALAAPRSKFIEILSGLKEGRSVWRVVGRLLVLISLVVLGPQCSSDAMVGATRMTGICNMVWIDSVRRGTMPLQIRSTGTIATGGAPAVRVVVLLDAIEGALARVGQAAEMDNRTGRAQGRLIDVVKDGHNGLIRVLAEFASDAPEKRPGAEITVTIDAGSAPGVLFVGRSAFGRSNLEGALFRLEPAASIAHRVRVRYGRVMGNFAEIVDGLNAGDQVILSDMTDYEHARRIRLD
jgi:hypothetical protein